MGDSWLRNMWRTPWKQEKGNEKVVIGVLAFEVASLMSKVVHLWQSLSDKQVARLREEIKDSVGIRKLVSEDEDHVVHLVCSEMIDNVRHIARAVARLGKKCSDPALQNFEHLFDELVRVGVDQYGWQLTWRKMEKKVKKMERLISSNANLYLEMETLVELEQTFRRMEVNDSADTLSLLEFRKKVAWKKQEVKNLQNISLWNRTYDYTVRLLARSLFTIFSTINEVFGFGQTTVEKRGIRDTKPSDSDYPYRSHSVSTVLIASMSQSANGLPRFSSGPLLNSNTEKGPTSRSAKNNQFHSGPLGTAGTKSGTWPGANRDITFFSGPLGKSSTKSGPLSATNKAVKKFWRSIDSPFNLRPKKSTQSNHNRAAPVLRGWMNSGNSTPLNELSGIPSGFINGNRESNIGEGNTRHCHSPSNFSPKHRMTTPETLGAAALALHYANVILVIEKLVASPHLIGLDARDDLYNMLPATIRNSLRSRLKPYTKGLNSYDAALEEEWHDAISLILEWLAPLAHNTIKWQSERSVEQQNFDSRTNVLLVQTLHFANQEKTELAITELLVGLNYIWRYGRDLNTKALVECASNKVFDEYLGLEG